MLSSVEQNQELDMITLRHHLNDAITLSVETMTVGGVFEYLKQNVWVPRIKPRTATGVIQNNTRQIYNMLLRNKQTLKLDIVHVYGKLVLLNNWDVLDSIHEFITIRFSQFSEPTRNFILSTPVYITHIAPTSKCDDTYIKCVCAMYRLKRSTLEYLKFVTR